MALPADRRPHDFRVFDLPGGLLIEGPAKHIQRLRYAEGSGQTTAVWLAVSIYLDIFNLFLSLLQILGIFGGRDE